MSLPKSFPKHFGEYFLGGLAAILFWLAIVFSWETIDSLGDGWILFVGAYILCVFGIMILLMKYSAYASLGFTIANVGPVLLLALFIIEITIHPPSEE